MGKKYQLELISKAVTETISGKTAPKQVVKYGDDGY